MAEKYGEIEKIRDIRRRLDQLSQILSLGRLAKDFMKKNPLSTVIIIFILSLLVSVLSKPVVRLILGLISLGLKLIAFIFVAKKFFSTVLSYRNRAI